MEIHKSFQQRQLTRGIETQSEVEYKGYKIALRAYNSSGINGKILKELESGKRIVLREEHYNFYVPANLFDKLKRHIDNHKDVLIKRLDEKLKILNEKIRTNQTEQSMD